ncbi:hypothetical protein [Acinetobacter populi]|uniref:CDI immunity protein domain-containing protein n=1 Tax=Acinetobacter populi TaxID=1582270 RepID=A0A1Z9YUN8_9GAMM|nr:hypothetical protein [Acinetobacter populi]OUY05869.1 hypothetical protein CAP51_14190 [Acinetobacter populi]
MIGYINEEGCSIKLMPLLWCLGFGVLGGQDLEYYLRGIIGKNPMEPVGGDPGWNLIPEEQNGETIYYAWVDEMMGLEPNEGCYDEITVKYHIRKGLENVLKEQPHRKDEINRIFKKYDL